MTTTPLMPAATGREYTHRETRRVYITNRRLFWQLPVCDAQTHTRKGGHNDEKKQIFHDRNLVKPAVFGVPAHAF